MDEVPEIPQPSGSAPPPGNLDSPPQQGGDDLKGDPSESLEEAPEEPGSDYKAEEDEDLQVEEESRSQSDSEEEEQEEEGEESGSSDGELVNRYSRRARNTVQRFTPGRPEPRGSSRHPRSQHSEDEEDSDGGGIGPVSQPSKRFSERYSVRNRRTVNRLAYDEGAARARGGSGEKDTGRDRAERAAKRARREGKTALYDFGSGEETSSDNEDLEDEDGDDVVRKTYSFRDRASQPAKTGDQSQQAQQGDRERGAALEERRKRAGGARRRGGRGGRFPDVDELPFSQPGGGGNFLGGSIPGVAGNLPGVGGGPAPWTIALNALGLGSGGSIPGGGLPGGQHPSAAIAAAGGVKGPGASTNGANLEISPLEVDPSVTFEQVGGLEHYVRALKEMVFLPLVYPELFERFHVTPPRGVLFYGPPGTGKTLVARALAAHASRAAGGRKVSFFMRKGADVLSKWVGESERHLRLLFEEARRHEPSIIFFDEIDGLAPVRSSRSDQIHNSIVSTLLALLDGLDPRGQVVVIGATNRVDSLDGALRRPGRFDRELLFPLPGQSARLEILKIHTKKWVDRPSGDILEELATGCVGYCGADLKALCTEASLAALRRKYPQIYDSEHKLLIDPEEVKVEKVDFLTAFQSITPASHRSAASPGRPLAPVVGSALSGHLQAALSQLQRVFPPAAACLRDGAGARPGGTAVPRALGGLAALSLQRPRLLIAGAPGCGQAHLGPALLYALEGLQTHSIGLPSLLSDVGARSPEEALVHAVAEARRAAPAVLYLPHLQSWWDTAPGSLRATLWALLADLPPDLPLCLLASADVTPGDLDPEARAIFGGAAGEGIYTLSTPTQLQRIKFFEPVASALIAPPPDDGTAAQGTALSEKESAAAREALPLAPEGLAAEEAARKEAAAVGARKRYEEDQATLRALRMALRWVMDRLFQARRWESFFEPVDPKEDPNYWELVAEPMDLSTLLARVDQRRYVTPAQFLADVALIPAGERQYWKDLPAGVRHISRACALEDEARALVESAVPAELQAKLEAILAAGGPAPPPEGLHAAMGLLEDGTMPQPAKDKRPKSRAVGGGREEEAPAGRRPSRLAGGEVDDRIIHVDPEAQLRRIKALKRSESGAAEVKQRADKGAEEEGAAPVQNEEAAAEGPPGNSLLPPAPSSETGALDVTGEEEIVEIEEMCISPATNAPQPSVPVSTKTDGPAKIKSTATGTTGVAAGSEQPRELSALQKSQISSLCAVLAECTAGLSLEALEEIHAQLGRLAWERRKEDGRQAVADAAKRTAEELSKKLIAAMRGL